MNIILWSDLQCPYCYTGEEALKQAIQELGIEDQVYLDIKTQEIHRPEDGNGDQPLLEIFQNKDGYTLEEAKEQIKKINKMGKDDASLDFDFGGVRESDDRDAHRLYKLARDLGKGKEMRSALHEAYFQNHQVLADLDVLLQAAEKAGIDAEMAEKAIREKWYENEILNDEAEADALKIESVPYFIVDQEVVPEHLSKDDFIKVLKKHLKKAE